MPKPTEYQLAYNVGTIHSIDTVSGNEISARYGAVRIISKYRLMAIGSLYDNIPEDVRGFREVRVSKPLRLKNGLLRYVEIGTVLYDPLEKKYYWMTYDGRIRSMDTRGHMTGQPNKLKMKKVRE